jgi:hypothetical protein
MRVVMTPPAVEGKRDNVEEKVLSLLRGVTGEDSSLHCSTIGNSLIRGDALVGLLAVEEVGHKFDDARNTCGTANQDDFMDVRFVNFGISEDLLDRVESTTEVTLAQLFETSTSEGGVEVDTLKEGVDFNGCLGSVRKGTLSALARSPETTNSTGV